MSTSPSTEARTEDTGPPPYPGMVWIPGGTFRMGSDDHYPEEAPAHRVSGRRLLDGPHPVTNAEFARFVDATGHVTFAESAPEPRRLPRRAARAAGRRARSCSRSRRAASICATLQLVEPTCPAPTGATRTGPGSSIDDARRTIPVVHVAYERRRGLRALGRQGAADRGRVGVRRARRTRRRRVRLGRRAHCPAAATWPTPGRANSRGRTCRATATNGPRRSGRSRPTATACST